MPIIQVHLMEGRTVKQKRALCRGLTEATVSALGVEAHQVRILIHHLTPDHYSVGGVTEGEKMQVQSGSERDSEHG